MPRELGKKIVVQGGTFYNDAVLRSFEKIAGCEAVRPDIAGIMGAFGAALIAKERCHEKEAKAARTLDAKEPETTMLSIDKINDLTFTTRMAKCQGLHKPLPSDHQPVYRRPPVYITETAVSAVLAKKKIKNNIPNLYDYKLQRYFRLRTAAELMKRTRGHRRYSACPEHV